ncbi:unnamed protein product, partial [Ilex paraguariensis]
VYFGVEEKELLDECEDICERMHMLVERLQVLDKFAYNGRRACSWLEVVSTSQV